MLSYEALLSPPTCMMSSKVNNPISLHGKKSFIFLFIFPEFIDGIYLK